MDIRTNGRLGKTNDKKRRIRGSSYWAAPVSALLLILSFPVFPRFQLWPLAWIGLVPLLVRLRTARWKEALLLGAAFGYPFMVGILAWVKYFGVAPWLALCFFEGAWFMGFTLLVALVSPLWKRPNPERGRSWGSHAAAILLPACAWIFIEWMRSLGTLSIPWGNLSHSQVSIAPLVSTARWWGAYGVSFLIVMVNSAIANRIAADPRDRTRANWMIAGSILLVVVSCAASVATLPADHCTPIRMALLQGNVTREQTATVSEDPEAFRLKVLSIYSEMSLRAARNHPAIIAWPETVVPGPLVLDPSLLRAVTGIAAATRSFMIVGSPHFTSAGPYNSAFILSPDGRVLGRYDKEHLVPFGEYTPFWRSFFERYGAPQVDLVRGEGHRAISTPLARIGLMICYESMYPQIARETVLGGAQILVVVTNDQWFGTSSAPYDHASDAPFRAAETGRWLAQDGTTGITLFADPGGHTYEATKMYTQAIDVMNVYPRSGLTLYTRLGDWPPIVSIIILLAAIGLERRPQRGRTPHKGREAGD